MNKLSAFWIIAVFVFISYASAVQCSVNTDPITAGQGHDFDIPVEFEWTNPYPMYDWTIGRINSGGCPSGFIQLNPTSCNYDHSYDADGCYVRCRAGELGEYESEILKLYANVRVNGGSRQSTTKTCANKVSITVIPAEPEEPNQPPVISISEPSTSTVTITPGTTVHFEGSASDPDGMIRYVGWSFSGFNPQISPITGNSADVTFSNSGSVRFSATDDDGTNRGESIYVRVIGPCRTLFRSPLNPTALTNLATVGIGEPVEAFVYDSCYPNAHWNVDFEDDGIYERTSCPTNDLSHTYDAIGTYDVNSFLSGVEAYDSTIDIDCRPGIVEVCDGCCHTCVTNVRSWSPCINGFRFATAYDGTRVCDSECPPGTIPIRQACSCEAFTDWVTADSTHVPCDINFEYDGTPGTLCIRDSQLRTPKIYDTQCERKDGALQLAQIQGIKDGAMNE